MRHTGPSESAPATGTALRVTAAARVRGREPARVGYSRSLSRSGLDATSAVAVAAASRMARFYPRWQCCCTWDWYVVRGNLKIGPVVHGKFLGQTGGLGPEVRDLIETSYEVFFSAKMLGAKRQGQQLRQFARSCRERAPDFGADRRREEERGRMGLREGRRVRDREGGSKTSEKCCLCRFCEKPFQSGPNGIQAHHGVQRTEKKQTAKLCKNTRRTSKQDFNRRCPARCEASSRRRPRERNELCARMKPSGAGVADDGERCTLLSRRHLPNRAP